MEPTYKFVSSRKSFQTVHILSALILLFELSVVSSVAEDYYNPEYDEDAAGIYNGGGKWGQIGESPVALSQLLDHLQQIEMAKRHLASVAGAGAVKGSMNNLVRTGKSVLPARIGNTGNMDTDDDILDDGVMMKEKRFLGTMARGGWFPRQFRGYTDPTSYDKRHVGSMARLGWNPVKFRDSDKRNLAALRKMGGSQQG